MGTPDIAHNGDFDPSFENATGTRRPLVPDDDPFYEAPPGFARAEVGTVLRVRSVATALFGLIPQRFPAWQLLYRTSDLHGRPAAAVTTVLVPAGWDSARTDGSARADAANTGSSAPRALLSFQSAIDAVSSRCFPSYALRRGARAAGSVPQFEFLCIATALSRGWVVSIPDHEGSAGRWGIPREPGYVTLDGIRAAVGFAELGLNSSTQVGLWGYSGGGLATAWAVEMAPEYAPEIPIVGGVLGSPVGDLPSAFLRLNGTLHAGLPTLVVAGLRRAYPELRRIIEQNVDAEGLALLASAEKQSTAVAVMRLARHDLDDHLTMPLADLLALPEMVAVFDDLQVGTRAPTVPLLVVQAVHDQIIDVDDIDGLVGRYHAKGVHVTYRRDRLSEHLSLLPLSAPASLDYLSDRLNGRELPPSGTSTVWSVTFSRSAARGLKVFVVNVVRMVLRRPISG